ncbi:Crp/Fnr family transcriptional regulator [Defluviicoccus vanus]|uniref:Crp/Fnr family transcriptional regulator n=1 Tax=Defluviicoccus vanus TaxID=111831 RepID=A0A7H1MYF6_9PROT|nr:Crp/Fnr family transcriptional regulator [Defluviicoccus vanus]QNT68492.1 Crp/Fnr family transcriptional regulator [Defluviicoccus vanus]
MLETVATGHQAKVSAERGAERSLLSQVPLLSELPVQDLTRIEQQCRYRRFTADELIVDRDSPSTDLLFLVRGQVRIVNYSMSGREITYEELTSGAFLGEISAIDGAPRSTGVMAIEDSLVLALPRSVFLDLCTRYPNLALKVMQRLAAMVRAAQDRILDLSTLAAQSRVQAELLRQAQAHRNRPNAAIIEPIPVHSDIASRVSTTRETVARVLNDLARKGILERCKGALVIHDMRRLQSMVSDVRG